ncbi:hypothetical protein BDR06DRAFT_999896 [Suillus hirtellus]|nr:hypothetical protein BDR06DRAFT_999896 [Suillus hirtellus]
MIWQRGFCKTRFESQCSSGQKSAILPETGRKFLLSIEHQAGVLAVTPFLSIFPHAVDVDRLFSDMSSSIDVDVAANLEANFAWVPLASQTQDIDDDLACPKSTSLDEIEAAYALPGLYEKETMR